MSLGRFRRSTIEWRHAWPVRFAHHPLCARHRHETWRIGRLNLCRGCASLAAGLVVGTTAVVFAGGAWAPIAAAVVAPVVLLLSWPAWYGRLPRGLRDALRALLGVAIATGAYAIASSPFTSWPLAPAAGVAWWLFRHQRARVNARRCDGCPELGHGVCSGYAEHARAMRAIASEIELRLVGDDGAMPDFVRARVGRAAFDQAPSSGIALPARCGSGRQDSKSG